jgi:hypothetical protein
MISFMKDGGQTKWIHKTTAVPPLGSFELKDLKKRILHLSMERYYKFI